MIPGKNGYDIPCLLNINGTERIVVVICHGFGGSKDSKTAGVFEAIQPEHSLGAICFDFPSHGDSPASIKKLSVANCVSDLSAVVAYSKNLAPKAEIVFFATSFGAFITLIYLAELKDPLSKAYLRSAALRMPQILINNFLPDGNKPDADGIVELKLPMVGTVKVTADFIDELQNYDLFKSCNMVMAKLFLLHGGKDNISPVSDAHKFAELTGALLKEIPEAGHFECPGGIMQAVMEAVDFYRADMLKNFSIKEIDKDSVPDAIDALWNIFMQSEASKCSIKATIGLKKMLEKEHKNNGIRATGAFAGETLIGGVLLREDMSKLLLLEVDNAHQGCGVAQTLLDTLLKSCGESISVYVPSFALNMYRDLGFVASADPVNVDGLKLVPMVYQINTKKK